MRGRRGGFVVAGLGFMVAAGLFATGAGAAVSGLQIPAFPSAVGVAATSRAPIPGSLLGEVWCQRGGDCMAAGYTQTNSTAYTLTERWDGTQWAVVPSPNPAGGTYSGFTDIGCASFSECFAGGHYYEPNSLTLIERWNGSKWSLSKSVNPAGSDYNYIYGFGCASATSCFAVGQAYHLNGHYYPLTELWNGSTWRTVNAPEPSGSQGAIFGGVACPAANDCFAVGINTTSTGANDLLTERWNGSIWAVIPTSSGGAVSGYLDGVTCVSARDCYALGFTRNGTDVALVEHWNGTHWSKAATTPPANATQSYLYNGWCLDATDCWAAGMFTNGKSHHTLIEHSNGSKWTVVSSPTPTGTSYNALAGLACSGAKDCVAVGFAETGGTNAVLVEHWNGVKWTIVSAPNSARQPA